VANSLLSSMSRESSPGGGGYRIQPESTLVANGLVKRYGKGTDSDATDTLIAAPLTRGSAAGEGVNQPGRRQEDDVNLVVGPLGGGNDGTGRRDEDDPNLVLASTLRVGGTDTGGGYDSQQLTTSGASVRRLTPTECERLQALPDGWTQLGSTPDSRRYAALGDAVTATVGEWIGTTLGLADSNWCKRP